MSDVKISALPTGTVASTDLFPVVKAGVTTAVTFGHTHPQSDVTSLTTDLAGKAALSHTHDAADTTTGVFITARLGTGTQTSTTFLRGDGSFADVGTIPSGTFFPGIAVTPLNQTGWSWVNQSSASVSQSNNVVFLYSSQASVGRQIRATTAPATPYTVTSLLRHQYRDTSANTLTAGILFRDLGGKLALWYVSCAAQLQVAKWTSPTVFSSAPLNGVAAGYAGNMCWFRMADDGTNLIFSLSPDGINFISQYSESRTAFFSTGPGPQQIGIFVADDAGAGPVGLSIFSWVTS